MLWSLIHIFDILLWAVMAVSVLYVVFFAFVSLFPHKKQDIQSNEEKAARFLILYPAYHEDWVIIPSVKRFLEQDYPAALYHLVVISDHMQTVTNEKLRQLPITLLTPTFEKSSKAKALQYAMSEMAKKELNSSYDYVVILDADNVVRPDFLQQLNASCLRGYKAIQCHRCAKNSNNDIAVLDGVSEEINNTIFRRAHNAVGLSSALIGSGMCFDYTWFKEHVGALSSAVEDRELEALLLKQKIFIRYEESIPVFDEKVSSQDNFQRQRLRWMTGQIQSLVSMLPYIPKAIATGNLNYIDKTIQQALIPRSILLVLGTILSVVLSFVALPWSYKWWCLLLLLCLSLIIAIPSQLRTQAVFGKVIVLPQLVWRMFLNIVKINRKNKDFIHTTHHQ